MALSQDRADHGLEVPDAWEYSAPVIEPEKREVEPSHAQKDPTLVCHDGKWRTSS
ncbi:MAG: hypothetical protein R3F19_17955 [Verrucomicrobiales bacterium]